MKKGLDYFPLDTDFVRDLKIQRLLLEFGCEGLSVFIAVLCEIYSSQGYYVSVKSGFFSSIGFPLKLEEAKVKLIIHFCLEVDLLDRNLYEACLILTSYGVQQRYAVISKRTKNRIKPEYLIVREEDMTEPETNLYINENINENENGNEKKTRIDYENKHSKQSHSDLDRQRELRRMARAATAGSGTDA